MEVKIAPADEIRKRHYSPKTNASQYWFSIIEHKKETIHYEKTTSYSYGKDLSYDDIVAIVSSINRSHLTRRPWKNAGKAGLFWKRKLLPAE